MMTDSQLVLVDTNVLLDVIELDQEWTTWSENQMSQLAGRMIINPLIYAELAYTATSTEEVDLILITLGLGFQNLSRKTLFLASQAYQLYRSRGGTKSAPLPDFFIGAHAAALGVPILTRDTTRYRTYFPTVTLISPTQ